MLGWRKILTLLAAALCVALAAPASAQTGLLGTPVPICVTRVQPGDTPAAMLAAPASRFDCTSRQGAFGPGDYWVRSAPLHSSGTQVIRTGSLWQDRATMWAQYADGHLTQRSYDGRAITRALQLGARVEMPLDTRAAPLTRLLWRVDGAANIRAIVLAPRLTTPEESARSNLMLAALYGAFGGLCLGLLVYNLALWAAQRHRFQLAYCFMVVALATYAFSSSGALAWAFPDIANNDRLRVNYLSLAASAVGAIAFARTFFEARVFHGWLSRIVIAVGIAVMGSAITFVVAAQRHLVLLDRLYALSFLLVTLAAVPILMQAWRKRSNYLWMFAYAWALPLLLAAVRVAGNFQLFAWSFLLDNSTLAAMAAEALLSSLAIAYRTRLLARERDEAREQEVAARQLADCDPLTGLLNRRAFLREAIGAKQDRQLIIVDIDHFKAVNDTLGHDGGDEVLRVVARVLRRTAADGALVARLGGEEFALLAAPGKPIAVEDVLDAIRAERMPFDLRVTASLGVANGPLIDETHWKQLYRDADQALFAAKAAGRDRARATAAAVPLAA